MRRAGLPLSLILVVAVACGDDDGVTPHPDAGGGSPDGGGAAPDAGGPHDWPATQPPTSTVPEPGVRREILLVPGVVPAANPVSGEETPAELNYTQVIRFRQDVEPAAPAAAVLVAYPGFLGGGASWEYLARALVLRGAEAERPIEVWAIDRRSNLLEDLRGLDAAEAEADPEIAQGYYYGLDTVGGQAFAGFLSGDQLTFMSEWGLETHVEDLHRVIQLVPEDARRDHVFLLGHSLGASFTEAYASWRFADGTRGGDELAGLVLIDGLLDGAPITEEAYMNGSGSGLLALPGVDAIRGADQAAYTLPIFGVAIYARVEILALRVLFDPDGVVADEDRDEAFRILWTYGQGPLPRMTNAAALGLGLDDDTNGLSFTSVSCGHGAGGAFEEYDNALAGARLERPTDPDALYTWVDAPDVDPPEHTPIVPFAHSWADGRTNFAEWYFPTRLSLDLDAVGGARVPEDGWQAAAGLRAFDGALIDAPVLAVSTELVAPEAYETLRARIAPAVGQGRVHAGATRDSEDAFRVVSQQSMTHIDPLTAPDDPANLVPEAIATFVADQTGEGTVTVDFGD